MNNNLLSQKYYRLKYFYHINPDKIAAKLKNSQASDQDVASLFHAIFKAIIPECKLFSEYILSDSSLPAISFFNDIYPHDTVCANPKTLVALCRTSLFHHCILHGFENLLSNIKLNNPNVDVKFNHFQDTIQLSGANDRDIENGFFFSLNLKDKDTENKDPTIYQKYHSSYYDRFSKHTKGYSHQLFLSVQNCQDMPAKLQVPVYQSNPFLFLFKSNATIPLDKALLSKSNANLVEKYKALSDESDAWKRTHLTNNLDSLLFDMVLEPSYGFILLQKLGQFLCQLNSFHVESSEDFSYHILEGQAFLEMISNYISTLPIVYNRFIFLEYACYAALHSDNLCDVSYPPLANAAIGQRLSSAKQSGDQFAATAIIRIGNFFRMLNYCTIPLLEDLWDVLTSELYGGIPLNLEHYTNFLNTNYDAITADYSAFYHTKVDDFQGIWKEKLQRKEYDFEAIYNLLISHIRQTKLPNQVFPSFLQKTAALNQFSFLIRHKCQTPIAKQTSIDNIILSQSTDYKNKSPYYAEYDLFQKQYLNSIFDFITQYNPNVPF